MVAYNIFSKKNVLDIIIFLFITIVFLNHIHNNFSPFEPTEFKIQGKETFIKDPNVSIKKEISKYLISNDAYDRVLNRDCEITGDFHDRHKVRWLKTLFLKNTFNTAYSLNETAPYYLNILLHSILLFLSLFLLDKTFKINFTQKLFFLLYVTFVFQHYLSEYSYSIFEVFFLCLSLYASKNKNKFLFLSSCSLAVLNRESGFIILLTWFIFNKDIKQFLIFSTISSILFLAINYDLIKCLYDPKFFVPLEKQEGQVNLSDLSNISLFSIIKLIFINFLLPFGAGLYFLIKSRNKNFVLITLFIVYFLVFLIAAPLHNMSVRLILLPLIIASIYFYNFEKNYN